MRFWDLLLRSILRGRADTLATDHRAKIDAPGAEVAVAEAPPRAGPAPGEPAPDRWWTPSPDALREPSPIACPALSTEALGLERILATYGERPELQLPALPRFAERALRLLGRERYDARRVADEVANDQVLSASVMRLANCALYARFEKVGDLQSAVARLGANTLRSLLLQHSLQAAVRPGRGSRQLAAIVWNGSLASACILRGLATLTHADPEEAYLTGLLHDIGNLLVLREAQDQEALLRYKIDVDAFVWLCAEYHERLGKLIGQAWELPEKLRTIIADHHGSLAQPAETAQDRALLAFADMTKCMLGYAPPAAFDLPESRAAQALGLADTPELTALLDELPFRLQHIRPTF